MEQTAGARAGRGRGLVAALSLLAVAVWFAPGSLAQAQRAEHSQQRFLDPSFGAFGKVALKPRRGIFEGNDLAKEPGGKLVAVGGFSSEGESDHLVARFRRGGNRDTGFAGNGRKRISLGADDSAEAVSIQPDGKLVIAGGADDGVAVVRLRAGGRVDRGFGDGGSATIDAVGGELEAADVLLQPDGAIVVATTIQVPIQGGAAISFATYRLLPDGALDSSFGDGGSVVTGFGVPGADLAVANAATLLPGGRIVVGGALNNPFGGGGAFALARYLPDGSLDSAFGGDGRVATTVGDEGGVIDMYRDRLGRLVTAGTRAIPSDPGLRSFFTLIRYLPDGSLDPSFGKKGQVDTSFQQSDGPFATAITPAGLGRSFVAGQIDAPGGGKQYGLAQYQPGGQLDRSFGLRGRARTRFSRGQASSMPAATLIQAGEPVVLGSSARSMVLTRYLGG